MFDVVLIGVAVGLILCILLPMTTYLIVKMGTLGYLRGKQEFERDSQSQQPKGKDRNYGRSA